MREKILDGLWRPGGAFFQIGLGCVMSHHTAKANLKKGASWPPEAIKIFFQHMGGLLVTPQGSPTPWTRPRSSPEASSRGPSDY